MVSSRLGFGCFAVRNRRTLALYEKWLSLPLDDRRKIAEAVCEKIVIGRGEIDITYSHLPASEELCKYQTRL